MKKVKNKNITEMSYEELKVEEDKRYKAYNEKEREFHKLEKTPLEIEVNNLRKLWSDSHTLLEKMRMIEDKNFELQKLKVELVEKKELIEKHINENKEE